MPSGPKSLLLLTAGAQGAIGSTLAVALAALRRDPETVLPSLTTAPMFPHLGPPGEMNLAGWDLAPGDFGAAIQSHRVLGEEKWKPFQKDLEGFEIRQAPEPAGRIRDQVEKVIEDIADFSRLHPHSRPVLINLLPACGPVDLGRGALPEIMSRPEAGRFPDLAYVAGAVLSGIPVVNFTPNPVEIPALVREAEGRRVPLAGRDGKTGQTYWKVVLASALKARNLIVDGWYSLNILGNQDGKNLTSPEKAAAKLANKTEVLDEILGYSIGQERHGASCHTVRIDYYPPRGDAKEAWDTIDFLGLFGLPMSLKLNFLARDSILAVPLVLDLARWAVALQMAGRSGLVPELAFFFKKPMGRNPPQTFQEQVARLKDLEGECNGRISPAGEP